MPPQINDGSNPTINGTTTSSDGSMTVPPLVGKKAGKLPSSTTTPSRSNAPVQNGQHPSKGAQQPLMFGELAALIPMALFAYLMFDLAGNISDPHTADMDADEVQAHARSNSVLMPPGYLRGVVRRAVRYMVLITCLQLLCRTFVQKWTRGEGPGLENSFQLTNLLINLGLGLYGLYWWFLVLPHGCPDSDKIGHPYTMTEECLTPAFFSEFQMAYQLWSIPLCVLVGESSAMMAHHVCVSVLAVMCSTLITSTRYYCVFYFGVVESSSVFLSVMNAFRSRPGWIEQMPTVFASTKILFSATFLLTRIVLWIPHLLDFFRIAWNIGTERAEQNEIYHVLIVLSFVPSFALTFLQIFWAGKIVKGLIKMITKPTDSEWHSGMSAHGDKEE